MTSKKKNKRKTCDWFSDVVCLWHPILLKLALEDMTLTVSCAVGFCNKFSEGKLS